MNKIAIIGAGLTGALLRLQNEAETVLIDKGRSVGGRFATRRMDDYRLNHGVPYLTEEEKQMIPFKIGDIHEKNQLIKQLVKNEEAVLQQQIVAIRRCEQDYELVSDSGWTTKAQQVIVTAPVPQALQLLTASGMNYDEVLMHVTYRKAIVLLIIAPSAVTFAPDANIERAVCQSEDRRAWSLYLTEQVSDEWFEEADDAIVQALSLNEGMVQVKRWRYALCHKPYEAPFYTVPNERITLIGDGFGQQISSIERIVRNVERFINR